MKKIKILSLVFVSILIVGTFTSCKEKTGDLTVVVKNTLDEPLPDKTVFLYETQADLDAGQYYEKATTNSDGEAYFLELEPKTWFFDSEFTFLGIDYYKSGSATVDEEMITTSILKP